MNRFAEVTDLQARLQKTYTAQEQAWLDLLLDDASAYLRDDILGWQVFPEQQVTVKVRLDCGEFYLAPVQPVTGFVSVVIDGTTYEVEDYSGGFDAPATGLATVTFTAGYATAPESLKAWCCVLASQALDNVKMLGMLGSTGVSSISLDDFKRVWTSDKESTGYAMPKSTIERLQARFNSSAFVTGR